MNFWLRQTSVVTLTAYLCKEVSISFYHNLIFNGPSHLIIIGIERWRGHCASSYSYIQD